MNLHLKEIAGILIGISIFLFGSLPLYQYTMQEPTGITPSPVENTYPVLLLCVAIFGLAIAAGNIYCIIREKLWSNNNWVIYNMYINY